MTKIRCEITMSLDGFITGPNDGPEFGLGEGGERLHDWVVKLDSWKRAHGDTSGGETGAENDMFAESFAGLGAHIMGRRMFDIGEPHWGDEPPFRVPVFVVTHRPRDPIEKRGGTTFIFVPNPGAAIAEARKAAGDKDVLVSGGANIIQQLLADSAIDELQIHIAPVIIGQGRRLFDNMRREHIELIPLATIGSDSAAHLSYRVSR